MPKELSDLLHDIQKFLVDCTPGVCAVVVMKLETVQTNDDGDETFAWPDVILTNTCDPAMVSALLGNSTGDKKQSEVA